ncbi:MAG: hypothetical protein QM503_04640 [Bacteroidota bacterium]
MQYILTGKKSGVKIVFKYDLRGYLRLFEAEGIDDEKQLMFLFWNDKFPFPYMQHMVDPLTKTGIFNIKKVEDDLSFERFWHVYHYKVSKSAATKLWNKLSKANKIKVFLHLPKYFAYLSRKHIEKAYPDTYLRKEKYEDEY